MKPAAYWITVLATAAVVGGIHGHTDEIPVVLGFILILSAVLGGIFPRRPLMTGFLMGAPVFLVETLLHYSVIRAPYPPGAGLPWPALFAFIPALGGAFFGAAVRHLNKESRPAN